MKFWLAGLLMGIGASCTPSLETPDAPDDLISGDSMVVVLKELMVIESYIQTRFQRVDGYYKVMTSSGKACLESYHISPDRFDRSYSWYVTEQEQLRQIYVQVREELTREVNKLGPTPVSDPSGVVSQPANVMPAQAK